jgi:L-asparagine oxygenase
MDTTIQSTTAQHHVSLSNHDKEQLVDFVASHCSAPSDLTDQQVLALVKRHRLALPSIQANLRSLRDLHITSLLVENLPVDPALPAPPSNGLRPQGKSWLTETTLLQLALSSSLHPMGLAEENQGRLVHEIAAAMGRRAESSSQGVVALGWHTDLAILPSAYRPDYLFLLGLLNQSNVPTMIADLDAALAVLDDTVIKLLRAPRFRVASPANLRFGKGMTVISEPRPLLSCGPSGLDQIAANLEQVTCLDSAAAGALATFKSVLAGCARPMVIAPGTALLFSNRRTLHARPGLVAGGQRWLERLYCSRSLKQVREATGSGPDSVVFPVSRLILE